MRRTLGVSVVLLLATLLIPSTVFGQQGGRERSKVQLEQNYPNPFNPTTTFAFTLPPELFEDGKPVVVSAKIYNPAMQLVATPLSKGEPGGPAENLVYTTPGRKELYWEGMDRLGSKVASGVYLFVLVVNGERQTPKKIVVAK